MSRVTAPMARFESASDIRSTCYLTKGWYDIQTPEPGTEPIRYNIAASRHPLLPRGTNCWLARWWWAFDGEMDGPDRHLGHVFTLRGDGLSHLPGRTPSLCRRVGVGDRRWVRVWFRASGRPFLRCCLPSNYIRWYRLLGRGRGGPSNCSLPRLRLHLRKRRRQGTTSLILLDPVQNGAKQFRSIRRSGLLGMEVCYGFGTLSCAGGARLHPLGLDRSLPAIGFPFLARGRTSRFDSPDHLSYGVWYLVARCKPHFARLRISASRAGPGIPIGSGHGLWFSPPVERSRRIGRQRLGSTLMGNNDLLVDLLYVVLNRLVRWNNVGWRMALPLGYRDPHSQPCVYHELLKVVHIAVFPLPIRFRYSRRLHSGISRMYSSVQP
jgi:hypothetical protein